jgi:hypothetical protein
VAGLLLVGGLVKGKAKAALGLGPKYDLIFVTPNAEQLEKVRALLRGAGRGAWGWAGGSAAPAC